jgi:two-component system, OmpR family, KDP operon response regulator KdpE
MSAQHAILVVDDEAQILRVLRPTLEAEGYVVLTASSGAEALAVLQQHAVSALILDLGLPDVDGKDIIRHVRKTSLLPIIVLSARESVGEKVNALDIGANDYVPKPFTASELLARLRVALRGQQAPALDQFSHGALFIDFALRRMTLKGRQFRLSSREAELLKVLVRGNGQAVGHKQIIAAVWPDKGDVDAQYVRVLVNQLRQKIETEIYGIDILVTEPGLGYRIAVETLDQA